MKQGIKEFFPVLNFVKSGSEIIFSPNVTYANTGIIYDRRALKARALEKAKSEGITLKALLIYALKGFVEEKISFDLHAVINEPEVEEVFFKSASMQRDAKKIAAFLK